MSRRGNPMQRSRLEIVEGVAALLDRYGQEAVIQHRGSIADLVALTWGVRKELAEEYITIVLKGRQAKLILETGSVYAEKKVDNT